MSSIENDGSVFNPFMRIGLFSPNQIDESICQLRDVWFSYLYNY